MKQQTLSIYLLSLFIFFSFSLNSAEKYFPGSAWDSVSPESQNIESKNVQTLIDLAFTDNATLGVVVIKNGRIIGEKYAAGYNMNSHGTSWSMACLLYTSPSPRD